METDTSCKSTGRQEVVAVSGHVTEDAAAGETCLHDSSEAPTAALDNSPCSDSEPSSAPPPPPGDTEKGVSSSGNTFAGTAPSTAAASSMSSGKRNADSSELPEPEEGGGGGKKRRRQKEEATTALAGRHGGRSSSKSSISSGSSSGSEKSAKSTTAAASSGAAASSAAGSAKNAQSGGQTQSKTAQSRTSAGRTGSPVESPVRGRGPALGSTGHSDDSDGSEPRPKVPPLKIVINSGASSDGSAGPGSAGADTDVAGSGGGGGAGGVGGGSRLPYVVSSHECTEAAGSDTNDVTASTSADPTTVSSEATLLAAQEDSTCDTNVSLDQKSRVTRSYRPASSLESSATGSAAASTGTVTSVPLASADDDSGTDVRQETTITTAAGSSSSSSCTGEDSVAAAAQLSPHKSGATVLQDRAGERVDDTGDTHSPTGTTSNCTAPATPTSAPPAVDTAAGQQPTASMTGAAAAAGGGGGGGGAGSSSYTATSSSSSSSTSYSGTVLEHPRKRRFRQARAAHHRQHDHHQQQQQQQQQQGTARQTSPQPPLDGDTINATAAPSLQSTASAAAGATAPFTNNYKMFAEIRQQVERRKRLLFPVAPKAPRGFRDYLLNRRSYVLYGNKLSRLSMPNTVAPGALQAEMKQLFADQEMERYELRVQHIIEKEKLVLAVEQEVLRVHARAARALSSQPVPFSACTLLKHEEVYTLTTCEQQEEKDASVRDRYNGRQFCSWLQDVEDKWEKIREDMILRQHGEAEALHAVQTMEWSGRLRTTGGATGGATGCQVTGASTPLLPVDPQHVPMVKVIDDFDMPTL